MFKNCKFVWLLILGVAFVATAYGETVKVRRTEGAVHGFLVLRSMDGKALASGDLIQEAKGDRLTVQLIFHFKDGSLHHETAVLSQRGSFKLLSDHLVQKGPSFKNDVDVMVDCTTGEFTAKDKDKDGKLRVIAEHLDLPDDLSNGIVLTLLKNIDPVVLTNLSMVVATPKPRMLKLKITSEGEDTFTVGGASRKATHYRVKMELGGATGLIAGLIGKLPPDTNVWILGGEVPGFVKSEGPFFDGGPIWRIELASPAWPKGENSAER